LLSVLSVVADPMVFGAQAVGSWRTLWAIRSFSSCACKYTSI